MTQALCEIVSDIGVLLSALEHGRFATRTGDGWSAESRNGIIKYLRELDNQIRNGIPVWESAHYRSAARGLDAMGIFDEDLTAEMSRITSAIARLG